jgi:hypothetical protein
MYEYIFLTCISWYHIGYNGRIYEKLYVEGEVVLGYIRKEYVGVEAQIHSFLTLVLDEILYSASHHVHLTTRKLLFPRLE